MPPIEDHEVEAFIAGWNWDEKMHEYARQMGRFLLEFLDSLEESNLSAPTMRKHRQHCWCIGWLEIDYGYRDTFSPTIFLGGPSHTTEFERKVSDSKYAISAYAATWRKLEKYVHSQGYGENHQ